MTEFQLQLDDIVTKSLELQDTFERTLSILHIETSTLLDDLAPLQEKTVSVAVVDTAPWFDSEYLEKRKERHRAEKKWKNVKDITRKCLLKRITKNSALLQPRWLIKKLYVNRMIENANGNPRVLYRQVNRALDRKQSRMLLEVPENIEELAKPFNEFFVDKIAKIRHGRPFCSLPSMQQSKDLKQFTELEEIMQDAGIKTVPNDILQQQLYKKSTF
jgi:hypothetical protein